MADWQLGPISPDGSRPLMRRASPTFRRSSPRPDSDSIRSPPRIALLQEENAVLRQRIQQLLIQLDEANDESARLRSTIERIQLRLSQLDEANDERTPSREVVPAGSLQALLHELLSLLKQQQPQEESQEEPTFASSTVAYWTSDASDDFTPTCRRRPAQKPGWLEAEEQRLAGEDEPMLLKGRSTGDAMPDSLTQADGSQAADIGCALNVPQSVSRADRSFEMRVHIDRHSILKQMRDQIGAAGGNVSGNGQGVRVEMERIVFTIRVAVDGCVVMPSVRMLEWQSNSKSTENMSRHMVHSPTTYPTMEASYHVHVEAVGSDDTYDVAFSLHEDVPIGEGREWLRLATQAGRHVTLRSLDQKLDVVLRKLSSQMQMLTLLMDDSVPALLLFEPAEGGPWYDPASWFNTKVKLFFLCSASYRKAETNHGEGFILEQPREWVSKAMPYLKLSLTFVKVACMAGRITGLTQEAEKYVDQCLEGLTKDTWLEGFAGGAKDAASKYLDKVTEHAASMEEAIKNKMAPTECAPLDGELRIHVAKSAELVRDILDEQLMGDWRSKTGLKKVSQAGSVQWILND